MNWAAEYVIYPELYFVLCHQIAFRTWQWSLSPSSRADWYQRLVPVPVQRVPAGPGQPGDPSVSQLPAANSRVPARLRLGHALLLPRLPGGLLHPLQPELPPLQGVPDRARRVPELPAQCPGALSQHQGCTQEPEEAASGELLDVPPSPWAGDGSGVSNLDRFTFFRFKIER